MDKQEIPTKEPSTLTTLCNQKYKIHKEQVDLISDPPDTNQFVTTSETHPTPIEHSQISQVCSHKTTYQIATTDNMQSPNRTDIINQILLFGTTTSRVNNQHSSMQQANMPMVNHFGNVRQNDHQKYHQQNKRDFHQIPTFLNQSKVKAPESMTLPNLEKVKTQQPRVIPTGKYPGELLKNNTHKLKSNCDRPKEKHSDSIESEQNTNIQSVKVTENNSNSENQEQRDSTSFLEHGRAPTTNHPQKRKSL
ncbi:Hypothetical predicted protein [Mytilus galloprovincialis]|uniref:Uncharacterized protein n=1 Tax=Mytilus galloprovincialis TaxID=29158 RepID=A0A8B6D5Z5_MYTGA|nr:Hypothetical predicted protein [Mytilus galloprovincialis]